MADTTNEYNYSLLQRENNSHSKWEEDGSVEEAHPSRDLCFSQLWLPLTSCETLGYSLHVSFPWFPYL